MSSDEKFVIDSYTEVINGKKVKVRVFPTGLAGISTTASALGFDRNKNLLKPSTFIKRCIKKFGLRFDYSMTEYDTMRGTITVRCVKHDHTFPIQALSHQNKEFGGCVHCENDNK